MTDSELYAHFKRIAPRAYTVSFCDRLSDDYWESAELRARAHALAVRPKPPTMAEIAALHTTWREERLTFKRNVARVNGIMESNALADTQELAS